MFPVCKAPGPHSSLEEFLHSIILKSQQLLRQPGFMSGLRPIPSINEMWMDECAVRSKPLADQYNNPTSTEEFRNVDPIMSGSKTSIEKK